MRLRPSNKRQVKNCTKNVGWKWLEAVQKRSASGHCSKVGRVWKWPAKGSPGHAPPVPGKPKAWSSFFVCGVYPFADWNFSLASWLQPPTDRRKSSKTLGMFGMSEWVARVSAFIASLSSGLLGQLVASGQNSKHSTTSEASALVPRLWEWSRLLSAHLVSQLSHLENAAEPDQKPLNQALSELSVFSILLPLFSHLIMFVSPP